MTLDLDALEALEKAATPGPWDSVWNHGEEDEKFIWELRNAAPELLHRARLFEEAVALLREWNNTFENVPINTKTMNFLTHTREETES